MGSFCVSNSGRVLGPQSLIQSRRDKSSGTRLRRRSNRVARLAFLSLIVCVPAAARAAETIIYAYDALGRIINVSHYGGPSSGKAETYTFDPAGNRMNVTVADTLVLYAGQSMSSADGRFVLQMQTDGNLVLYGPGGATWWTATNGGSDRRMVMQPDGNLVVYNGSNQGLWASNTSGRWGSRLALQNDGNLVIYDPLNVAVWATGTIYQPPPCSSVSFAISSNGAVNEGASSIFTVTKSGATSTTCSVNHATASGSAVSGSDFTATSGTLSFLASETQKTVSVPTISDAFAEAAETFTVSLSSPSGGATIGAGTATATINANSAPNQPPVTQADTASVGICNAVVVNVTANDTDPEGNYPLALVSVGSSSKGQAVVWTSTQVRFTANGSTGSTQITYTVRDSLGATSTGILGITIVNGTGCM